MKLGLVAKRVLESAYIVVAGLLFCLSLAGTANAAVVPEVDPGSMASALTLLVGGSLLLAHRLGRKKSS